MTEHLRRFEVVYADPFGVGGENCYWRTARTAEEAMGTVPGAIRASEVPNLFRKSIIDAAAAGASASDDECAVCGEAREYHNGMIAFVPKPVDDYSNPEEWEVTDGG